MTKCQPGIEQDAPSSLTDRARPVEITPGDVHHIGLPFVVRNQSGFNFWDVTSGDYFAELEGRYYGWDNATVQITDVGPGYGPPMHTHPVEEIFVLVEGEGAFVVGTETIAVKAPCIVRVPPNTPHCPVSLGSGRMKMVDFFPSNQPGGAPSETPDPFAYVKAGGKKRAAMIENFKKVLEDFDADGDGKLSRAEAPVMLRDAFARYDTDGDGYITFEDAEGWR